MVAVATSLDEPAHRPVHRPPATRADRPSYPRDGAVRRPTVDTPGTPAMPARPEPTTPPIEDQLSVGGVRRNQIGESESGHTTLNNRYHAIWHDFDITCYTMTCRVLPTLACTDVRNAKGSPLAVPSKRILARLTATVVAAIMGLIFAPTAFASPQISEGRGSAVAQRVFAADNPRMAYESLSTGDRMAFDAVERVSLITHSSSATRITTDAAATNFAAAYSGCWAMSQTWKGYGTFGNVLFTYWQATRVCVSAGNVYSVSVYNYGGETSTPGWYVKKNPTTRTYNAGWEGRGLVQVYFALGVNGWDVQQPTLCGQLRLNANGYNYLDSASCNLN